MVGRREEEALMFLPGASGNTEFWKPVAAPLGHPGPRRFLAWPGFGGVPSEPGVRGIDDLVARVIGHIGGPVALLAQSMGSVIAVRAALEKPHSIRHLVLSVTSGGIDVARLGAASCGVSTAGITGAWYVCWQCRARPRRPQQARDAAVGSLGPACDARMDNGLSEAALARVDAVAALTGAADRNWRALRDAYDREDALRVPRIVMNFPKGVPIAVDLGA